MLMDRECKDTALVSLNMLGHDRRLVATSRRATDIALSPDGSKVVWEELFHVYVSPMLDVGRKLHLAPKRTDLPVVRLTRDAGEFLSFSADGQFVYHSLADTLQVNSLDAALAHKGKDLPKHETIDLSFEVAADMPNSNVVLTHARILTMEGDRVIERGFLHVTGNRIANLGKMVNYVKPDGATEIDRPDRSPRSGEITRDRISARPHPATSRAPVRVDSPSARGHNAEARTKRS